MLRFCMLFLLSISSSLVPQHLWEQISPDIIQHTVESRYSEDVFLKQCCANALICHGKKLPAIDPEQMQTIQSVHLLSQVLKAINQSNLRTGCFFLAKNMCQFTAQPDILDQRQQLNSYLQNNPELVQNLNQLLANLKEAEGYFLCEFHHPSKPTSAHQDSDFLETANRLCRQIHKTIYSNTIAAEYVQRSAQLTLATTYFMTFKYFTDFHTCRTMERFNWKIFLSKSIGEKYAHEITYNSHAGNIFVGMAIAAGLAKIIQFTDDVRKSFNAIYQMQTMLIHMRHLINVTEQINELLKQHPLLLQLVPQLDTIQHFAQYANKKQPTLSKKMISLLDYLHTATFEGKPSYFFSFQGKILTTYNLYDDVKQEFIPLLEALGEIDALVAVQNLLALPNNAYCVPTWIQQEKPYLDITNYWHPVVGFEKSVKNSMNLGNNTQPYNVILTGANAGGKTTSLTAIMVAQILAQSIGIAPAQSLTATPFTRLHTYLDITTSLASNESLFVAQANRAQKLYNSITTCSNNEKCLSILDEIFTGTRADFAEQASYDFAKQLGQLPNNICILATHFPKLTELEKIGLFMNFQAADATITSDGDLIYPYKIIPGISTQNIAGHILKQKGILKN